MCRRSVYRTISSNPAASVDAPSPPPAVGIPVTPAAAAAVPSPCLLRGRTRRTRRRLRRRRRPSRAARGARRRYVCWLAVGEGRAVGDRGAVGGRWSMEEGGIGMRGPPWRCARATVRHSREVSAGYCRAASLLCAMGWVPHARVIPHIPWSGWARRMHGGSGVVRSLF